MTGDRIARGFTFDITASPLSHSLDSHPSDLVLHSELVNWVHSELIISRPRVTSNFIARDNVPHSDGVRLRPQ